MKKLFLSLLLFYSVSSFGLQEKDINVTGGFGAFGSRGLIGFSADKFLTANQALTFAVGLDFVGATSTVGYKYFSDKINNPNNTETIRGKCFFIFDCDAFAYIGPSLQYAGGSTLKITEGLDEREYKIDPKWLGIISVGVRDVFKNNVTFDVELSYRAIMTGGNATQTVGLASDDRKSIERGYRAVGINVGIGYLF